ncbi:MAG: HEPN domain-containing protein [Treponema sp.]|jgi:HEPN domain-containing protein|nr:HEPN domain-containing protein [Treponema sp.]
MDKQAELQQWLKMADSDLNLAEFASKNMWPVPYEIICFHCQQAAEKYLKWFLVMHDSEPPKIHDLEEFLKLCVTIKPQFSTIYEKCSILSGYAVQTRYPNEIYVEKHDMDKALLYAQSVRESIMQFANQQGS